MTFEKFRTLGFKTSVLMIFFSLLTPKGIAAENIIQAKIDHKKIKIHTDGRDWKAGFDQDDGKRWILEYLLPGETMANWSELVRLSYIRGSKDPEVLTRYMAFTEKALRNQCRNVEWNIISTNEKTVVYEWSAALCGAGWQDQSEIGRAIRGEQGLYVLHYAIKKIPIPQEKREVWGRQISEASVTGEELSPADIKTS